MNSDFDARVRRVAAMHGIGVKPDSIPHVVRLVRESGAQTDAAICEAITRLVAVKEEAVHFTLKRPEPNQPYRDGATQRLELGNAIADQKRADAKTASAMKLTPEDRDRIRRWGGSYGLELANKAFANAKPFIDEATDDE